MDYPPTRKFKKKSIKIHIEISIHRDIDRFNLQRTIVRTIYDKAIKKNITRTNIETTGAEVQLSKIEMNIIKRLRKRREKGERIFHSFFS